MKKWQIHKIQTFWYYVRICSHILHTFVWKYLEKWPHTSSLKQEHDPVLWTSAFMLSELAQVITLNSHSVLLTLCSVVHVLLRSVFLTDAFKMPMQFSAAITESGFKSNIWHYMSAPEEKNIFSDVLVWPDKHVHLNLSLLDAVIYYSSCFFNLLYRPLIYRTFRPRAVLVFQHCLLWYPGTGIVGVQNMTWGMK